jgi:DNA invertase Pin-like site-specific DNA recombinase
MRGNFFSYLRVSTDKHGEHGYGIAAQRQAVTAYLNGGSWELLDEFVEVESGKRNDRPELNKAIAACKKHKAKLVIAKLDRLARNVHLISGLMESKVDFVCCDMPDANRLAIHILAARRRQQSRRRGARCLAGDGFARAWRAALSRDRRETDEPRNFGPARWGVERHDGHADDETARNRQSHAIRLIKKSPLARFGRRPGLRQRRALMYRWAPDGIGANAT